MKKKEGPRGIVTEVHTLPLTVMASLNILVNLFRTEFAYTICAESTDQMPVINIELEELDHSGRRSMERRRRRNSTKPASRASICYLRGR